MIKKDKAITLISLVVTIVILLILAGIAIATLTGENGLFVRAKQAQQNYSISSAKEKIELAISDLMVEQTSKGEKLRKEDLLKINSNEIDVRNTDNFPIEAICQNYKFNINENFTVTYVGEANETIITYTTEPEGYTNKDEVKVLVKISNPKGIKSIQKPGETDKILPQGQTEVGIDFTVTKTGHYELKVEDTNEKQTIKDIYIGNIDRIEPKVEDMTVKNINNGFKIIVNADDAAVTEEYSKSGIDKFEYYIDNVLKQTSTENNWTITGLNLGQQYSIYVVIYDKAGNKKQTDTQMATTKQIINFRNISTRSETCIGIDDEGSLYTWESAWQGALGNGQDINNSNRPIEIMPNLKFKYATTDGSCCAAIDMDNNLYTWGYNGYGGLGVRIQK